MSDVQAVTNGKQSAVARAQRLEQVLSQATDKPHVILLAGHPDPDAIGSALAHRRICDRLGISATIAHALPLSRGENRALVKLLGVPLVRIEKGEDLADFGYLSLVDASYYESTIQVPDSIELLTVVDHHRPKILPKAPFVDIRHDVGATATIYAEYSEQGLAPLGADGADDTAVATGMFFGIQTDTDDFAFATPTDFRAAAYLKPYCDAETLSRIGRRSMTAETMEAVGRALRDLEVIRDFAIAGVGRVTALNRDAIPTAADFIMRREDIDTVLVYGIVEDRVDGSLRTSRASVDPALFMQNAFGSDPEGRPYGGGRSDMGGFQLPLGFLSEVSDEEGLWRLVRELVEKRIARVVPDLEKKLEGRGKNEGGKGRSAGRNDDRTG
ncbi:MAG TPA: bifunctional oligoribonuclease/PAP phosphatase NrnA [Polyangiaceae bacterium]|nr:bifunctional oligoribonuclease/PAP phosphatase NrnA [Polyangiaceae bacterium]